MGQLTLATDITELSKCGMKEPVLFPERLFGTSDVSSLDLKLHVCVGDFRDVRQEEQDGKGEGEEGDGKIDPLNGFE